MPSRPRLTLQTTFTVSEGRERGAGCPAPRLLQGNDGHCMANWTVSCASLSAESESVPPRIFVTAALTASRAS